MEQDFKGSKIIYTNLKGSHSFVFEFLWKESHMWSYPEFHNIHFKSMQTYKLVLTPQQTRGLQPNGIDIPLHSTFPL